MGDRLRAARSQALGEVADGFILQLADLDFAKWMINTARTVADNAGRDPMSVKFCVAAPMYIGEDWNHMRNQSRWFGSVVGNHVADIVAKHSAHSDVPIAPTDYGAGREGYDYDSQGTSDNDHVCFAADQLVDGFCILGSARDPIEKLEAVREFVMTQLAGHLQHDNRDETSRFYGEQVNPTMKGSKAARTQRHGPA